MEKILREYDIQVFKLSNQKHDYAYDITDKFFEAFENSPISKGSLKVTLEIDKSSTLLNAKFNIKGSVELICDRSLKPYQFDIQSDKSLIFKYAEVYEELSDEIITIPFDIEKLNVAQFIYEFVGIEVPMKKLHPDFQGDESEEDELIYSSLGETEEEEDNSSDAIDPRWAELNKLKKN